MITKRFTSFAWLILVYTLAVILWGAFVRATGSGAGCGSHWPLCNGVVVPQSRQAETIIEFTHRVSSGLMLLLVVGLVIWGWKAYPARHPVRWGALFSLFFTLTEALLGAGLVLFGLVAGDTSMARAFAMAAHLVNTLLLLASLSLTSLWSTYSEGVQLCWSAKLRWFLVIAWLGIMLVGASGAVTALGDTVFPSQSVLEGIREDFSASAHFLIRLRFWHPVVSVGVGLLVGIISFLVRRTNSSNASKRMATYLILLIGLQWLIGLINVWLLAPIWIQLLHLLIADLIWIGLVVLSARLLECSSA